MPLQRCEHIASWRVCRMAKDKLHLLHWEKWWRNFKTTCSLAHVQEALSRRWWDDTDSWQWSWRYNWCRQFLHMNCVCLISFDADRVSYGRRALRITLKRYPWKLQHSKELKLPELDLRQNFANLISNKLERAARVASLGALDRWSAFYTLWHCLHLQLSNVDRGTSTNICWGSLATT